MTSDQQATRRPVIILIGAVLLAIALNAGYTTWAVGLERLSQQAAQQAQRQAGREVERKICRTLAALAALRPPPGNPAANPSRAFDQRLHATLSQLAPDLGCGR